MAIRDYHGLQSSPIYRAWRNMITRCSNPNHPSFHRYGGRGILVCDRWQRFIHFHQDMIDTHQPGLTLERRDNDQGYEPGNCLWATRKEQYRNRSTNRWVQTSRGPMILEDIATAAGIDPKSAAKRVRRGVTGEALFAPSAHSKPLPNSTLPTLTRGA